MMFRIVLLLLTIAFSAVPAAAQNTTCANRPANDTSNACANTRFVGTAYTNLLATANTWTATQTFNAPIISNANNTWSGSYQNNTGSIYSGAAYSASQVSGWINNIWAGSQYSVISPVFSASVPTGGGAGTFAARMSDTVGGGFGSIQTLRCLAYVDSNPSVYPAWCGYIEGVTAAGQTGYYIGIENSLSNNWAFAAETPYSTNVLNRATTQRYSCGTGSVGPNKCSSAIDVVENGAQFDKGIIFGSDSLDTSANFGEAIAMAYKQGLSFYTASGSRAWIVQSLTTASGGTFAFQDSSIALYGAGGVSYLYVGNTGTGVMAVGPSNGDQVVIYGNTAGGSGVDVQAQGADTNIDLRFTAKGTGKVSVTTPIFQASGAINGATASLTGNVSGLHYLSTIAVPTPSTCGTSPAVDAGSSNNSGKITFGSGTTTCTLTFADAFPTNAYCTISPAAQPTAVANIPYISAQSKTAFTISGGTASASYYYTCGGN